MLRNFSNPIEVTSDRFLPASRAPRSMGVYEGYRCMFIYGVQSWKEKSELPQMDRIR